MEAPASCAFCDELEIGPRTIYADADCRVVYDRDPSAIGGHWLVLPRAHIRDMYELMSMPAASIQVPLTVCAQAAAHGNAGSGNVPEELVSDQPSNNGEQSSSSLPIRGKSDAAACSAGRSGARLLARMMQAGRHVALQHQQQHGGDLPRPPLVCGFHVPPFISVQHLHLHVLQPPFVSCMRALKYQSNLAFWFQNADELLLRLQAEAGIVSVDCAASVGHSDRDADDQV